MIDRDLLGDPVAVMVKKPAQLPLNLSMGVSIRWGGVSLTVSRDRTCGSIVAVPVDLPDFGVRWAAALKVLYPGRRIGELDYKLCARALAVSPRTVEGYAAGQPPGGKVWWRAWNLHKQRLCLLVAPELAPPSVAELLRAAEAMRATSGDIAVALAVIADAAAQTAGGGASHVERLG
ncbi:hypothetical protein [Magnetospirillum sulfuroxidans]|uniref:Uncharacterized protein n=1 Tax=Magnetospirillum sulfuroxidans TaxID=611300 RepID=A0ABS5I9J7_9PROT|nr:hypothetical protein [Magnetospirillum sulfuroxidans]MBR9970827.1 hypothetical protein [Magnetospirillum sulfuroxidans]